MVGQGPFGKAFDLQTQIVNGKCPVCAEVGIFISLHKTIFRCTTCGSDIEQKVNGKISYMPYVDKNSSIQLTGEPKK